MKIAIVTGASSGMGREFVRQISEDYVFLDEIWVIARNAKKLKSLRREVDKRLVILPLDLRKRRIRRCCETDLSGRSPESSCWSMRRASERSGTLRSFLDSQRAAVRLNCEGLTAVTYLCLPFYASGKQAYSDVLRGCFYSAAGVRRGCGHQVVFGEFFQSSSHRAQTQRDYGHFGVSRTCGYPVF